MPPRCPSIDLSGAVTRKEAAPARPAGVEAQLQQPLLQREDVVPGHRRGNHQPEHPVAQRPPGLAQRPVGGRTHDAVGDEPTALLEGTHGPFDETVVMVVGGSGGERREQSELA